MAQVVNRSGCRFQKIRILKDQEIGRGAYGMVCKAECDGLLCAAKLLHPVLTCDRTVRSFHKEREILSSIKHPNIILYLGTHKEGPGISVLLMELLDSSLTAWLEESPSSPPLPFHTVINLCHDVSLALAYLHCNDIIHRDLSSNNVLLTKEKRAKVTDFGMCKLLGGDQHMSRLTQVPGCAAYMPPEAQKDKPTYTYKLDSFSYGVLTIQILTRKFPTPGPPRKSIRDPNYGILPIEVPIPEPERRKTHISLVDPSHPLLKVALVCLSYDEKDRPTSNEICSQVGEMKNSERYHESVLQEAKGGAKVELNSQSTTRDVELLQLREQLNISEGEKRMLQERIDEQLKISEGEKRMLQECIDELTSQLDECQSRTKNCDLEALVTTLRAESEANQQKYELEMCVSKSVQDEHRALQVLYMKERDKVDELKRKVDILSAENQELKDGREDKDKNMGKQLSTPPMNPPVEKVSGDIARQHSSDVPGSSHLSHDQTKKIPSPVIKKRKNFAICPSSNVQQFDAHESDVSALCFSPDGTCLATGGSDKVVKVWTLRPDMLSVDPDNCHILSGSKASIVSLQFDPMCKVVLAASNDNVARIWSLSDQTCKHSLVGHAAKVMAAKFLAEDTQKVVTGSHDRTMKLWDLAQNTCFRTVFTGSSCNDVIAVKGKSGSGCTLISGHLDKRIRFWDLRSNATASEITLPGKITSLDHFAERQLLLCCSQDDTVRLIDLRQNVILASFSANGFKVGVDWSRACFSPDGQYVAAGSADGSLFVWEVTSGRMKSKKEHTSSAVVVCGWHPAGQLFASGDRSKKVVLWTS